MLSQLYKKTFAPYVLLALLTFVSTLILWAPFIFKTSSINGVSTSSISFETVLKHWDGPLYIIPAKTMYDIDNPVIQMSPMGFDKKYFAAHLPLYPFTLKLIAPITGYPRSTVASTLIASIALVCFFYYFSKKTGLVKNPFVLSVVFLFFTPRFFIVRSVGSPEPLFLLLILGSIYYFIKERYFFSGLLGGLATMTKTPGILLFFSFAFFFVHNYTQNKKLEKKWFWIFLIPCGLLAVFLLYHFQYGNFWAYFNSGDNIHLIFPPFSVFNFQKIWVDTAWLEEIVLYYFLYLFAIITLFYKIRENTADKITPILKIFFVTMSVFFAAIISVQHRDISRYSLPLLPFALITFEQFFTSKKFLIVLAILIPAIYLYSWNFMLYNVAPIADWTPFL